MSRTMKQSGSAPMRPSRATLGRRLRIHASQTAWSILHGGSKSKPYPPLSYSVNRRDITGAELGLLLAASRSQCMVAPESPLCRQNYSYWCSPQGLHHAAKLEVALRRSVATVACFTTWDVYDSDAYDHVGEAAAGAGGDGRLSAALLLQAGHPLRQDGLGEEECPLTAQQHQQEREQAGSRRAGSSAHTSPPHTLSSYTSGSASAPASGSAPTPASCSQPSSSHVSSPSPSWPKPPTPIGVPDMEWNWLQPSSRGRHRNSSSSSSSACSSTPPSSMFSSAPSPSSASSPRPLFHPFFPQQQQQQQNPSSASSAARGSPGSRSRKCLVGFARATGDSSLVATIYDVAVHPAVRGLGIGRRLVKLLLQQVQARAVYDIGVVTPASAAGFWERCAFEDDREGSTFMTFVGRHPGDEYGAWAPSASQELLESGRLGFWKAAQQSESLRELLSGKLQQMRGAALLQEAQGTGQAGLLRPRDGRLGVRGLRSGARGGASGLIDAYDK